MLHRPIEPRQYFSLAYSDALTTAGVKASVGTARGSYDNALADAVDGLYKTELIYSRRVWGSVSDVEIATMAWAHWWSTRRIHEVLGYRTPAEVEATYTHPAATAPATV
ncbi:integrase core domain-containing protein [Brachybacterium paraconglomeratum]|uniref:integrase core domain-containing protein n=1 Tax=Brachybacterium paraconglomeratum TaxID=173362 RepID=UPI0037C79289